VSQKSQIEWTEHTWNPIVGCSIVSPGCTNCYAMRMAARIEAAGTAPHYAGLTKKVNGNAVWTGKLSRPPDRVLTEPLRRKKPTMYFVNSMGDLFHEDCPDEWIDRVFAIMALCPQHTFQVLTKRAERMREYFIGEEQFIDVHPLEDRYYAINSAMNEVAPAYWCKRELEDYYDEGLPLPHVWLGVSAERQQEADERIPLLLQTPAAVRFISAEPLLGPIDLRHVRRKPFPIDTLTGAWAVADNVDAHYRQEDRLHWVIVGGESGPHARPMRAEWACGIRDQCKAAGVPFFFKQWGTWVPSNPIFGEFERVGKKAAGRLLDGREWNEFPNVAKARTQAA
jgi:protein gp37